MSGDDDQLGRWVGEVVRRWAAIGVSAQQQVDLFSRLLSRLTLARTTAGTTSTFTRVDPATYADTAVQRWSQDQPAVRRSRRRSRATQTPR